ncbi:hypothetical protein O3G_MSEX001099 [Manduca sexta]|nr:hypothetical protein O3G_MSEX001099 [Manduca sexta]
MAHYKHLIVRHESTVIVPKSHKREIIDLPCINNNEITKNWQFLSFNTCYKFSINIDKMPKARASVCACVLCRRTSTEGEPAPTVETLPISRAYIHTQLMHFIRTIYQKRSRRYAIS